MERRLFELLTETFKAERESDWKPIPRKLNKPIKEENLKECVKEDEPQVSDLLLYISRVFNMQQLCDFYWIVSNLQSEYGVFMTKEGNQEFAKVYSKALDDLRKHNIGFRVWKETLNTEFNKWALPEHKEELIFIATLVLLNKDKYRIYNILERNIILTQVESGDYFPF